MSSTTAAVSLSLKPVESRKEGDSSCPRPEGPGWFDSSWELHRGLEVREGWSEDHRVHGWIEEFLAVQRAIGRTASPSTSTAIA